MNSNQFLQSIARIGVKYKRRKVLKWCLKKRQQQLHKEWGWTA